MHTPDVEVDHALMRAPLGAACTILLDRLLAAGQEFVVGACWNPVRWSLTPGPDFDSSELTGTDERPDVLCRDLEALGHLLRR